MGAPRGSLGGGTFCLCAPQINTGHLLINGGREPVKFLAMTNAPVIMDVFHNSDFVFNNPYQFSDRYKGEEDFFAASNKRYERGMQPIWETNFIPDIKSARLDSMTVKGAGVEITQFEVSGNGLIGHISGWPEGRIHNTNYHGAGAILLGLQSSGYVLLWSKELGTRPYAAGHGGDVVEVKWKAGSVYCPPGGWFHQHFNTEAQPARH